MASSLPPLPQPLELPKIVQLPIQPHDPRKKSTGRVGMAQLRRIGEVVVAWGRLESSLSDLIWTINGKDLSSGRFETQGLDISKLLSAIQKAVSTKLRGPSLENVRKAITNIMNTVNTAKSERNAVVHGTWGELNGQPVVGSLRFEPTSDEFVTFENYPPERMIAITEIAVKATKNTYAIISRLEAMQSLKPPSA